MYPTSAGADVASLIAGSLPSISDANSFFMACKSFSECARDVRALVDFFQTNEQGLEDLLVFSFKDGRPHFIAAASSLIQSAAQLPVKVLEAAVEHAARPWKPMEMVSKHLQALPPQEERMQSVLKAAAVHNSAVGLEFVLPMLIHGPETISLLSTTLVLASAHGSSDVLHLLLEPRHQGAPALVSSAAKDLALLEAARLGRVAAVQALVRAGADVHVQQDLALREAAQYSDADHKKVLELLLDAGANVHVAQDSPLLCAATHGHLEVLSLLLRHGADPGAQHGSALIAAALNGHQAAVEQLLAAGAPVDAQQGMPLIRAASSGHESIVGMLIAAGANVHAQYDSALVAAARGGHTGVVAQLLSAGADVAASDNSALCAAVSEGHAEVMCLLLAAGADLSALEDDTEALCHAAAHNHLDVLSVVLHSPSRQYIMRNMGNTLMAVAGHAGCAAVVSLLLSVADFMQPGVRQQPALPPALACSVY